MKYAWAVLQRASLLQCAIAGPFVQIYYSSQFAPLVIFFLLFLSVVKNNKLPHFVRFNCMQGIMIDIVVMLFNILRAYFPAELRWSAVLHVRSPPTGADMHYDPSF